MEKMIVGGILYGLWLLSPVIVLSVLTLSKVPRSLRIQWVLGAVVFAIPAYLSLVCLFSGIAWPPDIFFRNNTSLASVSVPNYRIDYGQQWGLNFYETYYEVTRQDGLKAYLEIDGDSNRCWTFVSRQVGTKVYFLCDEQEITSQTSYVDTDQKLLYTGRSTRYSRLLDELSFREYEDNPLVTREGSGDNELYCPR